MQELKTTTPGPDGHTHIVYINTETGVGATSVAADGHSHELIYDPPRDPVPPSPAIPPQIDPNTGQPVMVQDPQTGQMMPDQGTPENPGDPGKPVGTWIIRPAAIGQPAGQQQPAQMDMAQPAQMQMGAVQSSGQPGQMPMPDAQQMQGMHDHELVDYVVKLVETKESDKEILEECLALWREGLAIVQDCRDKGKEAEEFYRGRQWEADVERGLNALDRAALTINEIGPNIDTLLGYQVEQRTDIKYLPQENGDQRVADMLNVVVKKATDACYFPREESKVFKDQVVPGFGAFNVYMDFNNNIQGELKVERFPWQDIVYGPHEKEDLSDAEFEVRSRMQSIAKLKQLFGKKAKEIEDSYKQYCGQYPDLEKADNGVNGTNTDYRSAKKLDDIPYTVDGTLPLVDVQKKQFRLVQCTRKIYKEVTVLFNTTEEFFFTAYDWKPEDIAAAATIPGFQSISQLKTRMRITRFCGQVILSDENPADLPMHDFYTVPVYGYRQNGEFWGKVEAVKDPQRELNKRRSQAMDTMNRLGASVYYIEPETFKDNNEKERFKKNRSKPGAIFDVNDVNRTPKLEEGAQFPAPLVNIMQMDQENLQRLMNIVLPQAGADTSGAAMLEQRKGKLTGNQFLFDNLSFAKQKLGKLLVALIQRYYGPERMLRLLDSQYSKSKFQVGGQDYATYDKNEILEMLSNADLLEYDVIVSESSFAPSTRLAIAQVLFELISKGAQVPPELALQFIDMPADVRAQINDTMQQQSQQAVQQAADTSKAEVVKTLIAKGQYTVSPDKAQELGLVPATGDGGLPAQQSAPNNGQDTQATEYANNLASSLAG